MIGRRRPRPPLPEPEVDLERFCGSWYVLGGVLTPFERVLCNAVEDYRLDAAGNVQTRFRFRVGSVDGPFGELRSTGFVADERQAAVWGMQFVAPFKLDYRIAWVAEDYGATLVARQRRDLLWIMARSPDPGAASFGELVARAEAMGYDPDDVITLTQRWPA